jgi:hypothetical protein
VDKLAFVITTCGQHYQVKYGPNPDTLFELARHIFPVRSLFEQYLQTAATLPEKFVRFTDPGPFPEEDFEVLLGDYQTILDYVRLQEEGIEEDEEID